MAGHSSDAEKNRLPQRRNPRLRNYDYSQPGAYFITVVTAGRRNVFGHIEDGEFFSNEAASIILSVWQEQIRYFPTIKLDAAIVMPNHFHAIVWIEAGSIGLERLMQVFKSLSTRKVNASLGTQRAYLWQRSYYDHVIRDEADLNRIREYIWTNTLRWHLDHENPLRSGDDEFEAWLKAVSAAQKSQFILRDVTA